jgi:ABC-type Fe3+-hydroxamate transport system substrate-binding protein
MRKTRLLLTLIVLLILVPAPARAQDGFPRTVTDATGTPVTIPARPQWVAVLGNDPALALVLPPDARQPIDPARAPDWDGVGLLVLPDLYAAAYPALVEAAQAAGVPVFRTALVTSLDDWRAALDRLGRATGREVRAAAVRARLEARLDALTFLLADRPPVRAFVLTPEGYTFGAGTLITDLLAAAGAVNVAAADFADFRQIDDAALRTLAPDAILLTPAWDDAAADAFRANSAYADIPAVQHGRVVRLPFDPTQPADPGTAAVALAILLHPQAVLLP